MPPKATRNNQMYIRLCHPIYSRASKETQLEQGRHLQPQVKQPHRLEPQRPRRLDTSHDQNPVEASHREKTKITRTKVERILARRCPASPLSLRHTRLNEMVRLEFISNNIKLTEMILLLSRHLQPQPCADPQQCSNLQRPQRRPVHHALPLQEDNHHCPILTAAVNPVAYPQSPSS